MKKGVIFLVFFCFFLLPTFSFAVEELEVCGQPDIGKLNPNGEEVYQIAVPAGIHLMVEMDTTTRDCDLYIKYGGIPDQDCNTDDDCDTGDYCVFR